MCFSKQPEAPISTPAYKPEDMDKNFTSKVEKTDSDSSTDTPDQVAPSVVPKISRNNDKPLRM
jgi:flagellar basal body rod protein FlgB